MKTEQKPGPYKQNQMAKQDVIFSFIDQAIEICKKKSESFTGVELFCADGFYANYTAKKHRTKVKGLDLSEKYLKHARTISKLIDVDDKVSFDHCDVLDLQDEYDFAICADGLYHLSDPMRLLNLLKEKIRTVLIIQTVVSLANTDRSYFESPAPGKKRGCRFSYEYLLRMVSATGWEVKRQHQNELDGNPKLEDRGSAYLLCV